MLNTFSTWYVALCAAACLQSSPEPSAIQARLNGLVSQVGRLEISEVAIVRVPTTLLPLFALKPGNLEQGYFTKLTIRDLRGSRYQPQFVDAMKGLAIKPAKVMPDLRWAVIFYDEKGSRRGGLYFGADGTTGSFDDTPVEFVNSGFFEWLEKKFSPVLY